MVLEQSANALGFAEVNGQPGRSRNRSSALFVGALRSACGGDIQSVQYGWMIMNRVRDAQIARLFVTMRIAMDSLIVIDVCVCVWRKGCFLEDATKHM